MSVPLLLLALVVIGVVAAVAAGRIDGGLPAPVGTGPHRPLPPGPLHPADVDGVRFSLAVRGYRMDEVDAVLARLREELADRDARLEAVSRPVSRPVSCPDAPTSARASDGEG